MQLDPVIVLHGQRSRTDLIILRSFQDIRDFLRVDSETRKIGITAIVANAKTDQEQALAVAEFARWARMTGLLAAQVSAAEVDEILR